jgi:hypothetical protein
MNKRQDFRNSEDQYWLAVALCLERFHGYAKTTARHIVREVRSDRAKDLASSVDGLEAELLYHEEPFYLACDISGKESPLSMHRAEYEELLSEVRAPVAKPE